MNLFPQMPVMFDINNLCSHCVMSVKQTKPI
uniref:Uncharacterized protein n=1 Tax=Anguilla anguilla TaxID=7936 RepID=A0A0E9QKL6_ANGAN